MDGAAAIVPATDAADGFASVSFAPLKHRPTPNLVLRRNVGLRMSIREGTIKTPARMHISLGDGAKALLAPAKPGDRAMLLFGRSGEGEPLIWIRRALKGEDDVSMICGPKGGHAWSLTVTSRDLKFGGSLGGADVAFAAHPHGGLVAAPAGPYAAAVETMAAFFAARRAAE